MINEFTPEVMNEIGFYVYRLIDPRNGNTFYVGKGKGNRVFAHINAELTYEGDEDAQSEKISTIREIHSSGLDVIHVIHRHGLDNNTALEVEAALIDAYPGLSNEAGGRGSRERGPMNAYQIQTTYRAEIIEKIEEKCIIIKIKQWSIDRYDGDISTAIYEATRASWKLSMSKAREAEYVISVLDGMVVAVYGNMQWSVDEERARLKFEGNAASQHIWGKYVGKRIPQEYRRQGQASPCLYVNYGNEIMARITREHKPINTPIAHKNEIIDTISEKCLIIKITKPSIERQTENISNAIYEATRYSWKLSRDKAEQVEYVLSVLDGVVVAVYGNLQWGRDEERGRLYFDGSLAPQEISKKYIGKQIPSEYVQRGMANPCMYVNL